MGRGAEWGGGARLRLTCTRHVSRAPVTTEAPWTLLRALSPSLSSPASRAAPQVAYAQLEELSTLLRLHLRHGLQEHTTYLLRVLAYYLPTTYLLLTYYLLTTYLLLTYYLLTTCLRHGLQEEALWLLDGFEQLSGEVST